MDAPTPHEMYRTIFRIVRTWQQRRPVGHDLAMAARSIVRRTDPTAYRKIMKQWPDAKARGEAPAKEGA
jgi:hypothetical protein